MRVKLSVKLILLVVFAVMISVISSMTVLIALLERDLIDYFQSF